LVRYLSCGRGGDGFQQTRRYVWLTHEHGILGQFLTQPDAVDVSRDVDHRTIGMERFDGASKVRSTTWVILFVQIWAFVVGLVALVAFDTRNL